MLRLFLPLLYVAFILLPEVIFADKGTTIYAFRNFKTAVPQKMILVGEIQSKTKEPLHRTKTLTSKKLLDEYDTREDRVLVTILNRKGLRRGQKLYVIDKNPYHDRFREGNIVGEIKVVSIFYSPFYGGWALSGRGILLRIRKGQFVARVQKTGSLDRAFVLKRKGDHQMASDQYAQAIKSYRQAIAEYGSLAEAHSALGKLYFENAKQEKVKPSETEIFSFAEVLSSYERAWKYRNNFTYKQEEWEYYYNYILALNYVYQRQKKRDSRQKKIVRYLDRSIELAKEALRLEPQRKFQIGIALARAHYYRMVYYIAQSNPNERQHYDHSAKKADYWLKQLLKMEQKNGELLAIAILFYGHQYEKLNPNIPKDYIYRQKLRKMIIGKLSPYYSLYLDPKTEKRKPEVDRLLFRLKKL